MDFDNDTVIEWSIDTDSAETARTVSWKYAPNTEDATATTRYFTNFPFFFTIESIIHWSRRRSSVLYKSDTLDTRRKPAYNASGSIVLRM